MSAICGIYDRRRAGRAGSKALGRMLVSLGHHGGETRSFIDEAAGIALGYLAGPGFTPASSQVSAGWLESDTVVSAVAGYISRDGGSIGGVEALVRDFEVSERPFPSGLDGDSNVFLWDRTSRRLHLASDSLGCKPFYFYENPDHSLMIFASELRAILAHPDVQAEPDMSVLALFLSRRVVVPPFCIQKGATKVLPGEAIQIGPTGPITHRAFASFPPATKSIGALEDFLPAMREVTRGALHRITEGSSRVAVFQSGGVDSSLALAALTTMDDLYCESFTLSYEGHANSADDARWAKTIANELGVKHHLIEMGAKDLTEDIIRKVLAQFDEPSLSDRAFTQFFLCAAARERGFSGALNGDQSEGLWGGIGNWQKRVAKKAAGEKVVHSDESLYRTSYLEASFFDAEELEKMLGTSFDIEPLTTRIYDAYAKRLPFENLFDSVHGNTYLRWPMGSNGFYVNVVSPLMQMSVRSAYRDRELFEFARSIPNEYKGSEDNSLARAVLLGAFGDLCPSVREPRAKRAMPGAPWVDPAFPALRSAVFNSLERMKRSGLVQPRRIDSLIRKFHERIALRSYDATVVEKLWALFALQVWLDTYVHHEDAFAPVV